MIKLLCITALLVISCTFLEGLTMNIYPILSNFLKNATPILFICLVIEGIIAIIIS